MKRIGCAEIGRDKDQCRQHNDCRASAAADAMPSHRDGLQTNSGNVLSHLLFTGILISLFGIGTVFSIGIQMWTTTFRLFAN